jgi:hypothetical protein
MADDQTLPPQDGAASLASTQAAFSGGFVIPDDIKNQFPELAELITKSESMNDEERQYWVNILPIMTPEQIQNLKEILTNERTQLQAIDAKYEKDIAQVGQEEFNKKVEEERKTRAQERLAAEQQAKASEGSNADDLLKQIEGA